MFSFYQSLKKKLVKTTDEKDKKNKGTKIIEKV